jgi:GDPmannose 4,6-dehydratase
MLNKKIALIAGVTGQDGFYLSKLLIKKKYKIIGLSKRISSKKKNITIIKTNYSIKSLDKIIKKYKPTCIYNLAAISKPGISWEKPSRTFKSIIDITLNFLEIIKNYNKNIRFFNASSCEIFKQSKKKLNENSPIYPTSPYGVAKSAAHFLVSSYRNNYKMFAVNGIFFNHDSPRRKKNFLLRYLISESIKVISKKINKISLIDYRPVRDFGFAGDYMEAAYKILSHKKPQDFVIATGNSISVGKLTQKVSGKMNIPSSKIVYRMDNKDYINPINKASIKRITKIISWKPKVSLEKLILMMIKEEKNLNRNSKNFK